ncbi:MAG: hypothetical protein ACR2QA_15995 [Solirubrobacteraceae bacterium]
MLRYHQLAVSDAPPLVTALEQSFPEADVMVDVGAGSAAICAEWRRRGHQVVACERHAFGRLLARLQGVRARPFSLLDEPPARVGRGFHLPVCVEVAEHVPAELASRLAAFLSGLAPTIVFSAAPPSQGGHLHVNEQPPAYWDALFEERGAQPDTAATAILRDAMVAAGVQGEWYLENTRVFVRVDNGAGSSSGAVGTVLARGAPVYAQRVSAPSGSQTVAPIGLTRRRGAAGTMRSCTTST